MFPAIDNMQMNAFTGKPKSPTFVSSLPPTGEWSSSSTPERKKKKIPHRHRKWRRQHQQRIRSPPHGANANLIMVRDAGTTLLGSQHPITMIPHHSNPSHVDVRLAYGNSLPAHLHFMCPSLIHPDHARVSKVVQVHNQKPIRMKEM